MLDGQWKLVQLNRNGRGISHIFFGDDLLLFGDASFAQARFMGHILADFCVASLAKG